MDALRKAAEQALEAMERHGAHDGNCDYMILLTSLPPMRKPCSCGLHASITALRAALAEQDQEQEPVAELPAHPVRRAYDRSGAPCPNKGWTDAEANVLRRQHAEIANLRAALAQQEQEPVVVYRLGETDIYDFAGWLTTRPGVMRVGTSCEAGPMAEAVGEYLRAFPERFTAHPPRRLGPNHSSNPPYASNSPGGSPTNRRVPQ